MGSIITSVVFLFFVIVTVAKGVRIIPQGEEWIVQRLGDEEMANAAERFPINTPMNKEEYYYRSIFEEHFPSESAIRSVPSAPSVACSTPEALAWDECFKT